MNHETIQLMKAFEETLQSFNQFTSTLECVRQELDATRAELTNLLDMTELGSLDDITKTTTTYLSQLNTQLLGIDKHYKEKMKKEASKELTLIETLTRLEKVMTELVTNVTNYQNNEYREPTKFITVKEARNTYVPRDVLKRLNISKDEDVQILKAQGCIFLRHVATATLYVPTNTDFYPLLHDVSKNYNVYNFCLYMLRDNDLLCFHLLTQEKDVIDTAVTQFKISQNQLIYLKDDTIKIRIL